MSVLAKDVSNRRVTARGGTQGKALERWMADLQAAISDIADTSVTTKAALKALDAGAVDAVFVLGRTSAGDGGGGTFRWDASNLSSQVSADTLEGVYVAPDSAPTGGSGAWVRDFQPGEFYSSWYGTTAAALQAAITAAAGKRLTIDQSVSGISTPLTVSGSGTRITGLGPRVTTLTTSHASNDLMDVTGSFVTIENIGFSASVARSSGYYIDIASSANRNTVQNFYMESWSGGIRIQGGATQTIRSGMMLNGVATTGVGIRVDDGLDLAIFDILSDQAAQTFAGIYVTKCGDLTIHACQLIHCGTALFVDVANGDDAASVWAGECFFDNSTRGVYFRATGAGSTIMRARLDRCWFSSSTLQGVLFDTASSGAIDGVDLVGCEGHLNGSNAVDISDTGVSNIRILGGAYCQNTGAALSAAAGASRWSVVGARMGDGYGLTGNAYGVFVAAGASDNYQVLDCDLRGNVTANLSDGGTGQSKHIYNNLGDTLIAPTVANPNFAMNGAFDIWQRGTSFAYGGGSAIYCADRWKGSRSGAVTGATFSRQTGYSAAQYCLRAQRDSGNSATNNVRWWHQVESAVTIPLQGKTIIVSADARVGANFSASALNVVISTGTGTDESYSGASFTTGNVNSGTLTATPTTSAARYTWGPYTVPSDATELAVQFNFVPAGTAGAADYAEVTNFKIEVGGVATPYRPEQFAKLLADCQRFYEKSFDLATTPAQSAGAGTGEETFPATVAAANTNRSHRIRYTRTKRKTAPTVTLYSPSAASAQVYDQTAAGVCTSSAVANNTQSGFHVTTVANASTVVGGVLAFHWTSDADF